MRSFGIALMATLALAGTARAQGTSLTLGTGFGGTPPVGDAADFYNLGWNAQANLGLTNPSWPVGLRFDFMYSSLGGEDILGVENKLRIIAGLANVELKLTRTPTGGGFFLVGGPGVYNLESEVSLGGSNTEMGVFGGLGYKVAMTNLLVSFEGKFHNVFTDDATQLAPFNLVVEVPLRSR
jgi:hypothetical protein